MVIAQNALHLYEQCLPRERGSYNAPLVQDPRLRGDDVSSSGMILDGLAEFATCRIIFFERKLERTDNLPEMRARKRHRADLGPVKRIVRAHDE